MSDVPSTAGSLRLHHIGIVVADLEVAAGRYAALGFGEGERHDIPEQSIRAITFRAGPGWVELIQPTDFEGPIARYMAKRGEGTHHVAYAVDDIAAELDRLREEGVRLIDETPRSGAHGWKIAFIHPEACNGVLTELVQE
ncbi:MAG TPA: methylmalonyl-CoA epimerase [Thermomicrobiales bacterium]|nr:methylmalonyl-CoA epimerase [Thermomicrobiales bacterium]